MTDRPFVAPAFDLKAYNCPSCNAYANQRWWGVHTQNTPYDKGVLGTALCTHCGELQVWRRGIMIFPISSPAPIPNSDMPQDVKTDYEEARSILSSSPRGAAALLRLAIQKLCKDLGESGTNINDDIAALVKKGLSPRIQKALDIVRVIGNESVHPGSIDMKDDIETATALFHLVNKIVEDRISSEKEIDALYAKLPADKIKGIEARDKKETIIKK